MVVATAAAAAATATAAAPAVTKSTSITSSTATASGFTSPSSGLTSALSPHQEQGILPASSSSSSSSSFDDVDIESLRQVLNGTSPEELRRRNYKPHELRELLQEKGLSKNTIPRFLLDPKEENHIAPHMVALELLLGKNRRGNNNGDGIYRRVDTNDDNGNNDNGTLTNNDEEEEQKNNKQQQHRRQQYRRQQHYNHIRCFFNNCLKQQQPAAAQNLILVVVPIISLFCQFVLEVFGGAGAIWGVAELARLRYGGIDHKSWNIFSWLALFVGICCLIRFILINCIICGDNNNISFYDKYINFDDDDDDDDSYSSSSSSQQKQQQQKQKQQQSILFLNKLHIVTKDPILFLRARCCCCYCDCTNSSTSS